MIWPWTRIRTLEAQVRAALASAEEAQRAYQAAGARAESAERALAAERERTDRLVQTIVELRRDGFAPPPTAPPAPPADDLPPEVRSAIAERAGKDARLAATLEAQARADLARMAPEEVAAGVLKGGDYDPWG